MDLVELRQEYVKFGGQGEAVQEIDDLELLELLVDSQKLIHQYTSDSKEDGIDDLERLEVLKNTPPPPIDTDEYRLHMNTITSVENRVRGGVNLPPKEKMILDSTLIDLLRLDDLEFGQSCKEFLSKYDSKSYMHQDLTNRLQDLRFQINHDSEELEKYLGLIDFVSSRFADLAKDIPERYIYDEKENKLSINPQFLKFKKEVLKLKSKLDTELRIAKSLEEKFSEPQDKRKSIYKLHKKISDFIQKNHLEE